MANFYRDLRGGLTVAALATLATVSPRDILAAETKQNSHDTTSAALTSTTELKIHTMHHKLVESGVVFHDVDRSGWPSVINDRSLVDSKNAKWFKTSLGIKDYVVAIGTLVSVSNVARDTREPIDSDCIGFWKVEVKVSDLWGESAPLAFNQNNNLEVFNILNPNLEYADNGPSDSISPIGRRDLKIGEKVVIIAGLVKDPVFGSEAWGATLLPKHREK